MGVEYQHWILPRDRDFQPSAEVHAQLIEALRAERWIVGGTRNKACRTIYDRAPGCRGRQQQPVPVPITATWITSQLDAASPRAIDRELALFFPVDVEDGGLTTWAEENIQYPFTVGKDDTSNYHEYQIVRADDFVAHGYVNGFEDPLEGTCACGAQLAYDIAHEYPEALACSSDEHRIRRTCPSCGARFDPRTRIQKMSRDYDAPREDLPGGVTFRFAIRVDCHKGWPRSDHQLALDPALLALVERILGTPCEDIGAFY